MGRFFLVSFFALTAIVAGQRQRQTRKCWPLGERRRSWSFIPCEPKVHNADPVARVFDGRLYVYTTTDDPRSCGPAGKGKSKGLNEFCMPGYRAYSTEDISLRTGWYAHGPILQEGQVPWSHKGGRGFRGAARMWALDVIQGEDSLYYMFFPAPKYGNDMRIGVAVSTAPGGPFKPRRLPVPGKHGIDPSVIQLPSSEWAVFTSIRGSIYVQRTNKEFTWAGKPKLITGLKKGYKEGPHAEYREGKLFLFYSVSARGKGYIVRQASAKNPDHPEWGFWFANTAIPSFDGRTNHAFNVFFNDHEWMFFHRHMEKPGQRWSTRKVVFTRASYREDGIINPIRVYLNRGFQVRGQRF